MVPSCARLVARDFTHFVELQDVAFFDVVEVIEADPALVPGRHLSDVVLEPAERRDRRVRNDDAVAKEADLLSSRRRALFHVAARSEEHTSELQSPYD